MVFHVNQLEGTLCQHSLLPMMHSVKRGLQAQSLRAWLRLQTHPCQVPFCPKFFFSHMFQLLLKCLFWIVSGLQSEFAVVVEETVVGATTYSSSGTVWGLDRPSVISCSCFQFSDCIYIHVQNNVMSVLQECPLHFTCRVACIESCGTTSRSISIFLFNVDNVRQSLTPGTKTVVLPYGLMPRGM
jgi:hypothetical protein